VSYLLIGFWYTRPTAIHASLKAFLVNRVGDFGFLLGIGLVLAQFGSLDYAKVFEQAPSLAPAMTLICLCLFVGAMGKSAQFPLHVWLPDSMEGPTPISALIHAATMVTAGIFMLARMAPLYELSPTARSVVLVIGGITALSMALVALTQYDIKRVVAYSTLSQLGYMTVALGASAYSAAIFHLMTHAFFKAVLFLAAGSVIIALHHEQDMRRMGGLKRFMPWTYWTLLVGAISSAGIPGFAGFFSKDAIIEAARQATIPGAGFAYLCVLITVFITAAYTFRLVFMAFHGAPRFDAAHAPVESPRVVTVPLVLLAIPSVASGWWIGSVVYSDFIRNPGVEFHGLWSFMLHGVSAPPFWLGAHRPAQEDRDAPGPPVRRGGAQVRLRRALRLAVRRRRARRGHRPVEGRRPDLHRRPDGQRFGAPGRLVLLGGAPVPVRADLPVRLHHDHRGVRAAQPVVRADLVCRCSRSPSGCRSPPRCWCWPRAATAMRRCSARSRWRARC
jgi:NADH-quinone oxidoreductase subunit L